MPVRPVFLLALSSAAAGLVAGFAAGWLVRPEPPPPPDVAQPVRVLRCLNTSEDGEAWYDPYRVVVGGVRRDVATPPMGQGEVYRLDLAGGQVVLFATRRAE